MKKIIIFLVVIVILVVAFGIFWFMRSQKPGDISGIPPGSIAESSEVQRLPAPAIVDFPGAPQGDFFAMGTPKGSVTIKNFYKTPLTPYEEFLILSDTNDYQITYNTLTHQFFIYASSSPFDISRQKGEAALLYILGTSKQDTCKLDVAEGFPQNSSLATKYLGLSFCSGGAFQTQ